MKLILPIILVILLGMVGWFTFGSSSTNLNKQTPSKPKVVGLVYHRQHMDVIDGLKKAMKKLGYTDKDIIYNEVKIIPGPTLDEDLQNAIRKMIADKVDVMFTSLEHTTKFALDITKESGSDIPIVFTTRFHDPLSFGIVESYKSSGNNATGVAINLIPTIQKTLMFFKEIDPDAKKVGVFTEGFMIPPTNSDDILKELINQAPRFGMSIVEYKTKNPPSQTRENFQEIADKIKLGDIDAIVHLPVHFYDSEDPGPGTSQEADETLLANRLHIPVADPSEDFSSGGTFSFSDDFNVTAEQVAVMIQKILNGTKPKDIPVEYGAKSILMLHLGRAKDAGIQFPESMLSIAEIKIN